ncbi:MAG: divalent cation transporter [Candidatus Makaraimicrobium thalassicum]|nr:MAG: divalent cation transporter [Candidatus Omnitrophota bacterium]
MNKIIEIIIYSLFAGITIFLGGLSARVFEKYCKKIIESYILHWSVAFGGGILIAAVALVLTPKSIEIFTIQQFTSIFLAGAFTFFFLDKFIEKKGGVLAQTMAMLMDFIPEAVALGAVFAHNHRLGILLAFFIGFQNLPESFNAYFDLRTKDHPPKDILLIFFVLSFLGVFSALTGRYLLTDQTGVTAGIMLFSGGGILYLIFQDIAPLSKMKNHWEPALGAILGFLVGMIGTKLLG